MLRRNRVLHALAASALMATTLAVTAPPARADDGSDCVPVEDGTCIPFTDIDENTEIYVAQQSDGTLHGFTDFNNFADWCQTTYGFRPTIVGGRVVMPVWGNKPRTRPDGTVRAQALWATFYDRGNMTGPAFILNPPNVINNLANLPKAGGGNWNNRISSVVTFGGTSGSPGAVLCARPGCLVPGWFLIIDNNSRVQLLGGFNNTASFVGVVP